MARVVTAAFSPGCRFTQAQGSLWQYDYGTVLHLTGLELPTAVEIHFATVEHGGESETRIGVTADGITEVKIPDALLEMAKTQDYSLYAFVYLDDGKSGQTEYKILMTVRARPKPGEEHPDTEKDHPLADAVQAVNAAADRAETAAGNAAESKAAAEDAAEQADKSRVAAETVAKHVDEAGRTALTGIASAKTDAAETIETTKTGAVKAVGAARETAIKAVADACTAAEQSLSEAKTDGVAAIETAKSDIEAARSGAIKDIDAAKTSGVQAVETVTAGIEQTKTAAVQEVETAKTDGVAAVNAAVEAGKTNFVTDESLSISGRAADAKVVGDELAKKADQTELEDVKKRQNILVGSETGSRVCVTDAFEAPLEGLVLYGKSTQVTTTGAQLLDIPDTERTIRGVTLRIQNGVIEMKGTATENGYAYVDIAKTPLTGTYTLSIDGAVKGALLDDKFQRLIESTRSLNGETACMLTFYVTKDVKYSLTGIKVMLNAGNTALPWEPYTGGKPSPSPDYPQKIQSAGDDGNLNVMVRGKNIFPGPEQPKTVERNGLTFSYKDGMYTLSGTSNENTWFNIYPVIDKSTSTSPTHNGNTICSDGKIAVVNGLKNKLCNIAFRRIDDKDKNTSITASNNKKLLQHNTSGVFIFAQPGSYSDTFTLMITDENQTEDYEPYHTPQTLTISTQNGLPGIMVTSGGNYTDEQGQQWICDEVNLERGVYVQRIYTVDVAELEYSAGTILQTVKRIFYKISVPSTGVTNKGYCTRLTYSANYSADNPHFYINEERIVVFIPLDTTIKPKEYLVQYVLATPIETPLSETDIAAYRALTTYGPTTIMETDGAGMKLDYQRDVNIVIKQLTDTIASMTN